MNDLTTLAAPLEIAHRGACGLAPENTLAAFDLALELGVDGIELDARQTRDGRLVVLHDPLLERTVRPRGGAVVGTDFADLAGADAGGWYDERFAGEPIPLLDDVLGRYAGRTRLYVELKQPARDGSCERELVRLLRRHNLRGTRTDDVLLQSFVPGALRRLAELAPAFERLRIFGRATDAATVGRQLPEVREFATGICPSRFATDAAVVESAQALGLSVHPHTVNSPEQMRAFAALRVDALFTDTPGRLRFALGGEPVRAGALEALPAAA